MATRNPREVGRGLPPPIARKIAHGEWIRTAHGGVPAAAPANTIRSLLAALRLDVDLIEVDLRRSADGRLVLWHDSEIDGPDGKLAIGEHTFRDLSSALERSVGEPLADLATAMRAVDGKAGLMIDLKEGGLDEPLTEALRRTSFAPVVVCGKFRESLVAIGRRHKEVGTSLTLDKAWRAGAERPLDQAGTGALTIAWQIAESSFVEQCHALGLAVFAWTVDDRASMRKLLAAGVDGITSNRPDLFPARS